MEKDISWHFFKSLASELESAVNPALILYCVVAVLLMLALCIACVMFIEKDNMKRGVMIQGLYRSNFALVGIPVADALMRGGDISVVAVLLAVVVPIFNVAAVIILEGFGGKKPDIKHVLMDVLKNPLIIASALGIVFLALDIELPYVLGAVVVLAAVLIASIPDLREHLHTGHDSEFHLGRLLNMVHAMRDGQFPVRLGAYMQNGYGAVLSAYYPELFLYLRRMHDKINKKQLDKLEFDEVSIQHEDS